MFGPNYFLDFLNFSFSVKFEWPNVFMLHKTRLYIKVPVTEQAISKFLVASVSRMNPHSKLSYKNECDLQEMDIK